MFSNNEVVSHSLYSLVSMTTPEHTLVGIHLAVALGVYSRFGWPAVALAGVASNLPDWDGLPMLLDMARFEKGHRVWGHNLMAIVVSSILLAGSEVRFRWIEWFAGWLGRFVPGASPLRSGVAVGWAFFLIAMVAQCVHLPCDMVVSGGQGLTDWPVQPWWPLSKIGYTFGLIPWGDVGPTLILMLGAIVLAKGFSPRCVSAGTLISLVGYLMVRGWMRGAF